MGIIKFGKHVKFGEERFGAEDKGRWWYQRTYRGQFIGLSVHGTIGLYYKDGVLQTDKAITYWNIKGVQHKRIYVDLPWPDGNPAAAAYVVLFKQAMAEYKTFSDEQKAPYIKQAKKEGLPNGHNVYVREYIRENK